MFKDEKSLVADALPVASEATPIKDPAATVISGEWNTKLFDCFSNGVLHKPLVIACCCPALILAQLLTRMKMTWLGKPTSVPEEFKKTFWTVLAIAAINSVIVSIFSCDPPDVVEDSKGNVILVPDANCSSWQENLTQNVSMFFGVYMFFVAWRLRRAIRLKYSLPEEKCGGNEDCLSICCCACCSYVQMANQTAEDEETFWFTSTGLARSEEAEAILV